MSYPVYMIVCTHPDYGIHVMSYVGCCPSGKSVQDRFEEHMTGRDGATYLWRAVQKYGREYFQVEQIDAGNTPEQALELEQWWIKRLGTIRPTGYNLTKGGDGGDCSSGMKHSAAWKQHNSNLRKKWWADLTPEEKAEHGRKVSKGKVAKPRLLTAELRYRLGSGGRGKTHPIDCPHCVAVRRKKICTP